MRSLRVPGVVPQNGNRLEASRHFGFPGHFCLSEYNVRMLMTDLGNNTRILRNSLPSLVDFPA